MFMNSVWRFWLSSVGKKYVMAITSTCLLVFVAVHMMGNLQIFLGPGAINHYAYLLHSNPELLWPVRIGLTLCAVAHVVTGIALTLQNRAARTEPYAVNRLVGASFASRTMLISGSCLLAYVIYHVLQFTLLATNPEYRELAWYVLPDGVRCHDVYRMVVRAFSNVWISAVYVLSMGLLCLHLSHGASALFQSLGVNNEAYAPRLNRFALLVAWVLFLGYAAVPLAVLFSLVK